MQFFVIKTKDLANLMFLCKTCSHGEGTNHLCRVVCSFTIQNLFWKLYRYLELFWDENWKHKQWKSIWKACFNTKSSIRVSINFPNIKLILRTMNKRNNPFPIIFYPWKAVFEMSTLLEYGILFVLIRCKKWILRKRSQSFDKANVYVLIFQRGI